MRARSNRGMYGLSASAARANRPDVAADAGSTSFISRPTGKLVPYPIATASRSALNANSSLSSALPSSDATITHGVARVRCGQAVVGTGGATSIIGLVLE